MHMHMHIHKVAVRNFRLLADADLALEPRTTLIVGRNNSGKTSLSEAIRRFLLDPSPRFQIEDFSNTSYDRFCDALKAKNDGRPDHEIRALIPSIELRLVFRYDPAQPDLGALSDFIVDLDPDCNEALVVARYELRDGAIESLFADQPTGALTADDRIAFFQELPTREGLLLQPPCGQIRPYRKRLRIPVKLITDSGVKPITDSGQTGHLSERSDAGLGL